MSQVLSLPSKASVPDDHSLGKCRDVENIHFVKNALEIQENV
jgi:hypothetical protein